MVLRYGTLSLACGLLKKLYRMVSLFGYQSQSSSSVSCSIFQSSSSIHWIGNGVLKTGCTT